MIKYYCDRCKKELYDGKYPIQIEMNKDIPLLSMDEICVICRKLIETNIKRVIKDWLDNVHS